MTFQAKKDQAQAQEQAKAPAFKKLKVSTLGQGHRRAGMSFGPQVTEVNAEDLSPEKLQQILNDPRLRVEKV